MRLFIVGYRLKPRYLLFIFCFLYDRVRVSAPDGSSPRVHMRLGTVGYGLRIRHLISSLCFSQPITRDLLDIGRRYAAMEAEVARLSQQSAELQGRPLLFLLLTLFRYASSLLRMAMGTRYPQTRWVPALNGEGLVEKKTRAAT